MLFSLFKVIVVKQLKGKKWEGQPNHMPHFYVHNLLRSLQPTCVSEVVTSFYWRETTQRNEAVHPSLLPSYTILGISEKFSWRKKHFFIVKQIRYFESLCLLEFKPSDYKTSGKLGNTHSIYLLYRCHMNRECVCFDHALRERNFNPTCFLMFISAKILVFKLANQIYYVEYLFKIGTLSSSLQGNMEERTCCTLNLSIYSCWNQYRTLEGEWSQMEFGEVVRGRPHRASWGSWWLFFFLRIIAHT